MEYRIELRDAICPGRADLGPGEKRRNIVSQLDIVHRTRWLFTARIITPRGA